MANYDVIVVGGGIAGASAAYFLSETQRVLVLEREAHAGYHATGRSGALWFERYGEPPIRALSRATKSFFDNLPDGFSDVPVLSEPCGVLTIALADSKASQDELESIRRDPDLAGQHFDWTSQQARGRIPILKPESIAAALFEPSACHIDVDALLQAYLRGARRRGGELRFGAEVTALERNASGWSVHSSGGTDHAPIVVNAAGAWAGTIGALGGAMPVPLQPFRRTALVVAAPAGVSVAGWPFVVEASETFYFKSDAGRILISPTDETPSEPMDAFPDEIDVAIAIDRVQAVADLPVRHVIRSWAGLRTFARDRLLVIGFDAVREGFFWLAGQGGFGLQTSAAAGMLASALAQEKTNPELLLRCGVDAAAFSPRRFSQTA